MIKSNQYLNSILDSISNAKRGKVIDTNKFVKSEIRRSNIEYAKTKCFILEEELNFLNCKLDKNV